MMMIKNITILMALFCVVFAQSQEDRYIIENLDINNEYSNFGTTFFGEDQVVYASPRKKSYIIRNVWKGNNQPFLDLFIGDISENGQLINIENFSKSINSRYHESDVAFTKDKKTVYFSRNNYEDGKVKRDSLGTSLIHLFKAKVNSKGEWIDIEPLHFNNDNYQAGHPTLSADEKTLYFISDMPGTLGNTDIYKASISTDGIIGNPINLGPIVNTPGKEMFPSISGNDELYFSSNGREGSLGGLDIYVSKIKKNKITKPLNLGEPMNSIGDDFSFILNYENRRGYFSSNRNGGKGDDDIYTFIQNIPFEFECNQYVKGIITEKNSGSLLPGAMAVLYDDKGLELERKIVNEEGKFNFEIDCNKPYKIEGKKEGFSTETVEFYSTEGEDLEVPIAIVLDVFVIERGDCIVKIDPIFFDFDRAIITNDAKKELDKVVEVMRKYPEIIIEGGSHTDSRGKIKYNSLLSTRRAKATVKYIIENGIDASRISAKGYGESEIINKCLQGVKCFDYEHAVNRRTEFKIVNYNEIKGKYPEICPSASSFVKKDLELNINNIKEKVVEKVVDINNFEFQKEGGNTLINMDAIYFDLNSSIINSSATQELYKVVKIMKKYPNLMVECGSHTDSRASDKYNLWLSDRRAKKSIDYIISKGINPSRISSKGFGESKLANNCGNNIKCSDAEHQLNRRTEFVVVNPEMID